MAAARLDGDARREALVATAQRLFAVEGFGPVSMSRIAREAGISKALLYHYFPGKRDLFVAALAEGAAELRAVVALDPALPPGDAVLASLDGYLGWIDTHREQYVALLHSAAADAEVREMVDGARAATAARLLTGLAQATGRPATPLLRTAVAGWLRFLDGAILDALTHDDLDRPALRDLLTGTLLAAVQAAGARPS